MAILTARRARELLDYDPLTGVLTWRVTRGRAKAGSAVRSLNGAGYVTLEIDHRGYRAHRVAWLITHGKWPSGEIDHINGRRDDNRLSNLRDATRSDNQKNCRLREDNTTGATGVYFHRQSGKWQARIYAEDRHVSLGLFRSFAAAADARRAAERRYFGDFAKRPDRDETQYAQ